MIPKAGGNALSGDRHDHRPGGAGIVENRLQHQFQRCLHHPVGDRGDPQTAQLAARLGNHPLPHRKWTETATLQRVPQPVEKLLDTRGLCDGRRSTTVDPRCPSTLVTPYPVPRDKKERGIDNKIEQIIEPAMRIITGPPVQFGLDLQYPVLRLEQGVLQLVGIHRRNLLIFQFFHCRLAGPLRHARASRTLGLLRGLRPILRPSVGNGPAHRRWMPDGRATTDGSHVHQRSIDEGGARLYSDSIATTTPQAFAVTSPPDRCNRLRSRPPRRNETAPRCTPAPIRQVWPALDLRSVRQRFLTYAFSSLLAGPGLSDSANPSRTLSEAAPAFPGVPRIRLPPSFTGQLRLTSGVGLSPPLDLERLVAHTGFQ